MQWLSTGTGFRNPSVPVKAFSLWAYLIPQTICKAKTIILHGLVSIHFSGRYIQFGSGKCPLTTGSILKAILHQLQPFLKGFIDLS